MTPCADAEQTEQRVRDLSEHRLTREPGFRYHYVAGPMTNEYPVWEDPDFTKISKRAQEKYEESVRW